MGAGASAQLPATVDVATQRRLGGICYLDNRQEAYGDVADAEAVPRERVLAAVAARGLDQLSAIFWQNLRHFFKVRNTLDDTWAKIPNHEAVERGEPGVLPRLQVAGPPGGSNGCSGRMGRRA